MSEVVEVIEPKVTVVEVAHATGIKGDPGRSAYAVAVENGFEGTEAEWLESLRGPAGDDGQSAYELAVAAGFTGTLPEWLDSLKGEDGDDGLSAYQVAVANGFLGTETQWLASLEGEEGPAGPTVVSTDAGNVATLGDDGHLFVPAQESGFTDAAVAALIGDDTPSETRAAVDALLADLATTGYVDGQIDDALNSLGWTAPNHTTVDLPVAPPGGDIAFDTTRGRLVVAVDGTWQPIPTRGDMDALTAADVGARPDDWTPTWGEVEEKPASFPPATHTHPVGEIDATGTPSASTYLRGDGTWATPEGGGSSLPPVGDDGEVLTVVGGEWESAPPQGGGDTTLTLTAADGSGAFDIAPSYAITLVEFSGPGRVRLYSTTAGRATDATRSVYVPYPGGRDLVYEYHATEPTTDAVPFTGFGPTVYWAITGPVDVTLTWRPL